MSTNVTTHQHGTRLDHICFHQHPGLCLLHFFCDDKELTSTLRKLALLWVELSAGDVVLLDNYRVLHGRNTFKGDRKHAVTWFESCGEPLEGNQKQKPDDFMNELINKTLV